jgi:DNA-directed RNA polymerase, beta subunit/140 kD subunit
MFKLEHTTDSVLHARFLGPRHSLTKQAVKGRKKGGGFTFGEFDSYQMLAHDVPAVLAELGYLNAESDEFIHVLRQKAIGAEPTLPDTVNIYSTRNLDLILTALYIKRTM